MCGTCTAQQMLGIVDQWSYIAEQGTQDIKYNTGMYQYVKIHDPHTMNTDLHAKIYDLHATGSPTYIDT